MSDIDDEIPQPWPPQQQLPPQIPPRPATTANTGTMAAAAAAAATTEHPASFAKPQQPWPQEQQPPPRYVPPPRPRPARKPTNPWMVIGWIILVLLVVGIYGAVKASGNGGSNAPQACPAGYYWNTAYQQCMLS
jgi:hypothetical protein